MMGIPHHALDSEGPGLCLGRANLSLSLQVSGPEHDWYSSGCFRTLFLLQLPFFGSWLYCSIVLHFKDG